MDAWGNGAKHIKASQIFTPKWKAEETINDINQGRPSMTSGCPIVAKFVNRSGYILVDGNHRVLEEKHLDRVWVVAEDWKFRAESHTEFISVKEARELFNKSKRGN